MGAQTPHLIQRRYVDFTGAPESMRAEFFELAAEVDRARDALGQVEAAAARSNRKNVVASLVAALVCALVGYWRGRRAAQPRIRITEPRK